MVRALPTTVFAAVLMAAVVVARPGLGQALRIDCGGPGLQAGPVVFEPDRPYAPGGSGYVGGAPVPAAHGGGLVEGTRFGPLFRIARQGEMEYRFDLPGGTYLLELHLAETLLHGPDQRRFSVLAEGVPLLEDIDLFALVEKDYAVTCRVPVTVLDGHLEVRLTASLGQPLLAGIGVAPVVADSIPPPQPPGFEVRGSYHRNLLVWMPVPEPDVVGYRVERAATQNGPFAPLTATPTPLARFFDDGVEPGQRWFYRVAAVDAWGNVGPPTPLLEALTRFDEDSSLPIFRIAVSSDELALLQADPFSDDYVAAELEHRGLVHADVGVRFRGNVTRHLNKKSWKVNFPGDAPFLGLDKLNLNAEANDSTMLKEWISYRLLEGLNLRAPSCSFAHLQVNGEYRGVFSRVENVDQSFIDRRSLDPTGNLYKADGPDCNFALLPSAADYERAWDKKTNEDQGYDDIIAFTEMVNDTPDEDFYRVISAVLDVDAFLDYYATLIFTANFDHVFHNYYMFHDLERDVWELVPKDWNGTFGEVDFAVNYGTAAHPGGPGSGDAFNLLLTRVLDVPELRQRYVDKLLELLADDFSPAAVETLVDAAFAEIVEDGRLDVFKAGAERNRAFEDGPQLLEQWVLERVSWLVVEAAAFAPGIEQTLFLNEVLAVNRDGARDQQGEREPWVEIHNAGSEGLDLGGYGLSDDPRVADRWTFPSRAVVPAGGHLLVWLDGEAGEGPDHAGFRIAREGGRLALLGPEAAGRPLLDVIAFGPQDPDLSFGRRHDGSALWCPQNETTPGAPNTGPGNLPPRIWGVHPSPLHPAAGEEVLVIAMVEDDGAVVSARLWYDLGDGWDSVPLADEGRSGDEARGDGLYGGVMPGAGEGVTVRYALAAADDAGRTTWAPADGTAAPYTLSVGVPAGPVLINELQAANRSTIPDEAGEHDDWLELYNPTGEWVDLSGMYLSDDLDQPQKWKLPDGTLIEPHGHLLVWADEDEAQGPLHAGFKLSADGEDLGLFETLANGNALIDAVTFPALDEDVSWGRAGDGSDVWVVFTSPTPGVGNGSSPRRAAGRVARP